MAPLLRRPEPVLLAGAVETVGVVAAVISVGAAVAVGAVGVKVAEVVVGSSIGLPPRPLSLFRGIRAHIPK
jgi:hypothetical protein